MTIATPRLLRGLVLVEVACGVSSAVLDLVFENTLPAEIRQYVARAENTPLSTVQMAGYVWGVILSIGMIVSLVGLWKLWGPARQLYTGCWLLGVPVYLLIEPVFYYSPVGAMLSEFSVLAAGMILGVIYFSDLSAHFERSAALKSAPAAQLGNSDVTSKPPSVS